MKSFETIFKYYSGTSFPNISAVNSSSGTSGNGTEWNLDLMNTLLGFFQAALHQDGATPSGNNETSSNSQILSSILSLSGKPKYYSTTISGTLKSDKYGTGSTLGAMTAKLDFTGHGNSNSVTITTIDVEPTTEALSISFDFEVNSDNSWIRENTTIPSVIIVPFPGMNGTSADLRIIRREETYSFTITLPQKLNLIPFYLMRTAMFPRYFLTS